MSFIVIFVVSSSCIPVHVSRTCSCDSTVSVHLRHLVSLYFPLKLFLTSSILVLALKMVDASVLLNSFMYFGRSPVFQFVFSRRKFYLRFSSACFLYVMSKVSFQLLWVDIFVFGIVQRFRKQKPKPKLNPPNAHRSQIKICEKWHTHNVQFRFMPNAFRILKPIQKSSKRVECFVTQVQTRFPKTKCVWPMKINVICTVVLSQSTINVCRDGQSL